MISHFEHLIYEYPILHILQRPCFSWNCGKWSTLSKRISSLGKGTAGGLRFLAALSIHELKEGLPLERDVLLVAFPAKPKLFAIRLWNWINVYCCFWEMFCWVICLRYISHEFVMGIPTHRLYAYNIYLTFA